MENDDRGKKQPREGASKTTIKPSTRRGRAATRATKKKRSQRSLVDQLPPEGGWGRVDKKDKLAWTQQMTRKKGTEGGGEGRGPRVIGRGATGVRERLKTRGRVGPAQSEIKEKEDVTIGRQELRPFGVGGVGFKTASPI